MPTTKPWVLSQSHYTLSKPGHHQFLCQIQGLELILGIGKRSSVPGCVGHQNSPLDYQNRWDFQQPEHLDTCRSSSTAALSKQWVPHNMEMQQLLLLQLFPQATSEGLQGSQQRAWASPHLYLFWSAQHESFLSSLLYSLFFLQPWRSREWVGDAGGGKAPCSAGDRSNHCVQVLCGCCALEGEELHSPQGFPESPPTLTSLTSLSLAHSSIKAEYHRPSPPPNVPVLTVVVLSQAPTDPSQPHFLLLKSLCPPSPEEEHSPTVPAWTSVGYWGEILERATCSTTSTPGKPSAKSDTAQTCSVWGDRGPLHLG